MRIATACVETVLGTVKKTTSARDLRGDRPDHREADHVPTTCVEIALTTAKLTTTDVRRVLSVPIVQRKKPR